jgi:hypothetical protein
MWGASAVLLSLVLSFSALAAPSSKVSGCNISVAKLRLPAHQTVLAPPKEKPSFISVAIGTQNYTCGTNGQYTCVVSDSFVVQRVISSHSNVGAVAELFDISCFYGTPFFNGVQDPLFAIWNITDPSVTPQTVISLLHGTTTPVILGE